MSPPARFGELPAIAQPKEGLSRSRRVRQRYHKAVRVTRLANQAIVSLNCLSQSCTLDPPNTSSHILTTHTHKTATSNDISNSMTTTKSAARCHAHVYRSASRMLSRQGPHEGASPLRDEFRGYIQNDLSDNGTVAIPIIASKVGLPSGRPPVPIIDLLPPNLRQRYAKYNPKLFRTPPAAPSPPRVYAADGEYIKLIIRLVAARMMGFTQRPKVVNGAFSVPKQEQQRIILDARASNAHWVDPDKVELPGPDLLASLRATGPIVAAKVDADNFFHRLLMPDWMHPYFALPAVRAGDVGASEYPPDTVVYPMWLTLPMGWSHSPLLAQSVHECILRLVPGFEPRDAITKGADRRLDRPRHQVYIDDLILLAPANDAKTLATLQDHYCRTLDAHGLVVKWSKLVRPSGEGVECLGLEVHGNALTVGLHPSKLAALRQDTLDLVQAKAATGRQLLSLLGRWTWAMLARRPALSVFASVYRFVRVAKRRRFRLWPSVRQELTCVAGLAPLLYANIGARSFPRLMATDASSLGQGVVSTHLGVADAGNLATVTGVQVAGGAGAVAQNLLVRKLVRGGRWSTIVSSRWSEPEHINVLELRAALTGVRWALSSPRGAGARIMLLVDNTSVVGALSKGRSSSWRSRRPQRVLSGLLLAFGASIGVVWVPSALNPADEPSRV